MSSFSSASQSHRRIQTFIEILHLLIVVSGRSSQHVCVVSNFLHHASADNIFWHSQTRCVEKEGRERKHDNSAGVFVANPWCEDVRTSCACATSSFHVGLLFGHLHRRRYSQEAHGMDDMDLRNDLPIGDRHVSFGGWSVSE